MDSFSTTKCSRLGIDRWSQDALKSEGISARWPTAACTIWLTGVVTAARCGHRSGDARSRTPRQARPQGGLGSGPACCRGRTGTPRGEKSPAPNSSIPPRKFVS